MGPGITESATVFIQTQDLDLVPGPFDEKFATFGTVCVRTFFGHDVSDVNVIQSFALCQFLQAQKGVYRGQTQVQHIVIRMESGEMDRHIRAEVCDDPVDEFPYKGWVIIVTWNDKISKFKVDL